jgi:thymidylate synthase (FAD)
MSPFRHMQFTFLIHTSEVVCRQMYKHQVGMGYTSGEFRESATVWNEISGRYVELSDEFHRPTGFRRQHPTNRQASLENELVDQPDEVSKVYDAAIESAYAHYKKLRDMGVCREQARMVLPLSFMSTVTMTCSLEAAAHFIKLRDHEGAQLEIRKLARAMKDLLEPICPVSVEALLSQ